MRFHFFGEVGGARKVYTLDLLSEREVMWDRGLSAEGILFNRKNDPLTFRMPLADFSP